MINLIWPFLNIEMELAETIYITTLATKKLDFQEANTKYLVKIKPNGDRQHKNINF